jgi:hypothetical protein
LVVRDTVRTTEKEKETTMSSLALTGRGNRIIVLATLYQNPTQPRTRLSHDRVQAIRASLGNVE